MSAAADSRTPRRSGWPWRVVDALADLRITVTLLGLSLFLVLAGTLAQVNHDIWDVVHGYFRVSYDRLFMAWIPLRDLVPNTWFPAFAASIPTGWGFWYPGGYLLGGLLGLNQIASMLTKFKLRARGSWLWAGLAATAAGVAVSWRVIEGGMSRTGVQDEPWLGHDDLWNLLRFCLAAAVAASATWDLRRLWNPATRWSPGTVLVGLATLAGFAVSVWSLWQGDIAESSGRILWNLVTASMAAVILLTGTLILFGRQGGTFLLHAGLLLLLASEFHTGHTAREAILALEEGQAKNYLSDTRTVELAFVTANDDGTRTHVVVAGDAVRRAFEAGDPLDDPRLPLVVTPLALEENADVAAADAPNVLPPPDDALPPGDGGPAFALVPKPKGTGVGGGAVDYPAGHFALESRDGTPLGTAVLSALFPNGVGVEADGRPVTVALRFEREYVPFTVRADDVSASVYPGTTTPSDYRSEITVIEPPDPEADRSGGSFGATVWMNNPLRYAGRTFYQSGYNPATATRPESTNLQVVTNDGWMVPYLACMVLLYGMAAQFILSLVRFLSRRGPIDSPSPTGGGHSFSTDAPPAGDGEAGRGRFGWVFPAVVLLLLAGYGLSKWRPAGETAAGYDLATFGETPVLHGGRFKPLDTVARNALVSLNGRSEFEDGTGGKHPATEWLLDSITDPATAAEHRVFRVEHPQVRAALGLEARPGLRYGLGEFIEQLPVLQERADDADRKERAGEELDAEDRGFQELSRQLTVLELLMRAFDPDAFPPMKVGPAAYNRAYAALWESNRAPLAVPRGPRWETLAHAEHQEAFERALETSGMSRAEFLTSPVVAARLPGLRDLMTEETFDGEADAVVTAWIEVKDAWREDKPVRFNAAVKRLKEAVHAAEDARRADAEDRGRADFPLSPGRIRIEAWFNHAAPLFTCWVLALAATAFTVLGWMLVPVGWSEPPRRSAFWLLAFTFAVQTAALGLRIYISGRPPVTNLYSSAVFIGWGAVGLGLLMEGLYGRGVGNALACVGGVGTLQIAHALSGDDTFTVMQAVLDTQFWLATHVVTITLGYAATGAAGLLGLFYVLGGLLSPALATPVGQPGTRSAGQDLGQALAKMIYGTACFATLLSLIGTILGGLWADDSWGRFWGWDPKENGALIIVIWNALVLHARWGKLVGERGLAVLAVAGNIAVAWSWFGTNELGVGLHSYGFTEGVLFALAVVAGFHLLIVAVGAAIPRRLWWSQRARGVRRKA